MDEMRRELQEGSRAGDAGRGRYCWRTRGLELGAREEQMEELLGLERGKRNINKTKETVRDSQKDYVSLAPSTRTLPRVGKRMTQSRVLAVVSSCSPLERASAAAGRCCGMGCSCG